MAIHPTAIIDSKAEIDSSVEVGPFCVIDGNVRIAGGSRLHQNVYVTGWTTIEADCVLHPGVIVGHEPQDVGFEGGRSFCRIGRGTILREYVTVHRGTKTESETVVGEDCFLLGGAHVAHNCVLGNRVTMINNVLLAGYVEIGDGVTFGGGAGVHQFVRIGTLAMVTGNARVNMDILPYATVNEHGLVAGLNRIGLRRAGVSRQESAAIREAYRIIYGEDGPPVDAADRVAALGDSELLSTLVAFLRGDSRRGLAGRSRSRITIDSEANAPGGC